MARTAQLCFVACALALCLLPAWARAAERDARLAQAAALVARKETQPQAIEIHQAVADVRAMLGLARNLRGSGQHERADEIYERALALVGSFLASNETYPEAIEIFRAVLERDPSAREPRLRLAEVLSWDGRFEESIAEYGVLLDQHPEDLDAKLGRAEVLSWAGRYPDSEAAFLAELEGDASNLRALRGLTRVYLWAGPNPPDDPHGRAMAFANQFTGGEEQFPLAIEVCRTILAEDARAYQPRLQIARVLAWSGRTEESVAEYDVLIGHYPDDLEARLGRAEALSQARKFDRAEESFNSILAEHRDNQRAAVGLARTYLWAGELDLADDAYRRALEIADDPAARAEWHEMQKGKGLRVGGRLAVGGDSEGFDRRNVEVFAVYPWDRKTDLGVRTARISVKGSEGGTQTGQEFGLSFGRRLGPRWGVLVSLAHRTWDDSPNAWLFRLAADYEIDDSTALSVAIEHGETLELLDSVGALREGMTHTGGSVAMSRGLGHNLKLYGQGQFDSLSDGNARASGYGSLTLAPWSKLSFAASYWVVRYSDRSDGLYWDPDLSWNLGLEANFDADLPYDLHVSTSVSGGVSFTRTLDDDDAGREVTTEELGPGWGLQGSLGWARASWNLLAEAGIFGSQRASTYDGVWAGVRMERRF